MLPTVCSWPFGAALGTLGTSLPPAEAQALAFAGGIGLRPLGVLLIGGLPLRPVGLALLYLASTPTVSRPNLR